MVHSETTELEGGDGCAFVLGMESKKRFVRLRRFVLHAESPSLGGTCKETLGRRLSLSWVFCRGPRGRGRLVLELGGRRFNKRLNRGLRLDGFLRGRREGVRRI